MFSSMCHNSLPGTDTFYLIIFYKLIIKCEIYVMSRKLPPTVSTLVDAASEDERFPNQMEMYQKPDY